jgi:hypothetical protein
MAEEFAEPQAEPTVIRDKRRLDPETGELRTGVPIAEVVTPADGTAGSTA